jgi:hypothetical protein
MDGSGPLLGGREVILNTRLSSYSHIIRFIWPCSSSVFKFLLFLIKVDLLADEHYHISQME